MKLYLKESCGVFFICTKILYKKCKTLFIHKPLKLKTKDIEQIKLVTTDFEKIMPFVESNPPIYIDKDGKEIKLN